MHDSDIQKAQPSKAPKAICHYPHEPLQLPANYTGDRVSFVWSNGRTYDAPVTWKFAKTSDK